MSRMTHKRRIMLQAHSSILCNMPMVLTSLAMGISLAASAGVYFNPAFLSDDPSAVADLSRFEQGGYQPPGVYQVDIYVNNNLYQSRKVLFHTKTKASSPGDDRAREDDTGLVPCLSQEALVEMGVDPLAFSTQAQMSAQCPSLNTSIPGAYSYFDFSQQRLDISIPQIAMSQSVRGYISPERWSEGIPAVLLNYSFAGSNNTGNSTSDNYFLSLNSGINLGGWRLRDNSTWNYTSSSRSNGNKWQHVSTYLEHSVLPLGATLVAGDTSTASEVFESLPMRGIVLATDDNMLSDSLKGFAPTVRGIARSHSQVIIRQNGYIIYQTYVPEGAFAISDLYATSSSGDLEVTVVEADGRSRSYVVPYSAVPVLQREGVGKYELAIGKYRSGNDTQDNVDFGQATAFWGLPHGVTLYGGTQFSDNYLSTAAGLGFNLGRLGALSLDATQANSRLADDSSHHGKSYRVMWAKSLAQTGTSLQLASSRFSSEGFYTLDQTTYKIMSGYDIPDLDGQQGVDTVVPDYTYYFNLHNTQKNLSRVSVSQNLGNKGEWGSLYINASRQTYWNTPTTQTTTQIGYSTTVKEASVSLNYSYTKSPNQQAADKMFSLSVSLPLSKWLLSGGRRDGDITRMNSNSLFASYSMSHDSMGRTNHNAGISGTLLNDNNLNYSFMQGVGNQRGSNSGSASLNYQGSSSNSNIAYSYGSDYRSINYGFSGGLVLHQEGLTLSQPLGDTNILIAAPGASNIGVANTSGVKTDSRGYAVIPYASTYRENEVSLNTADLPANIDLNSNVEKVVPTQGALALARFETQVGERALLTVRYKGKPLPFGTTVGHDGGRNSGIVGDEGQVYLAGLSPSGNLVAQWGKGKDQRCTASYQLPVSKGVTLQIATLQLECK